MKPEAPELEGLGFMDDTTGLLANLVFTPPESENSCIESIAFSSFNPVPGYRRYTLLLSSDCVWFAGKTLIFCAYS